MPQGRRFMTEDEVSARLIVLEVFAMTGIALYLANSRNDPDHSKAKALLDHMKQTVQDSRFQSSGEKVTATRYAAELADQVLQNLRALHGEGGATH
jgi:hypothetical protein